jgi:WD40 repeat protein
VLSEDGNNLVAVGEEGVAQVVWDLAKHQLRPFGPEQAQAKAFDFSADEHHLATVSQNRDRVEIWDEGSKKARWSNAGEGLDAGKNIKFADVALSPDGRYLLIRSEDEGAVWLWDVPSNKPLYRRWFAAAFRAVWLWDVHSNKPLDLPASFLQYSNVQSGLAFSPDGDHLATATPTRVVVWDIANSSAKYIHAGGITTMAFSRDGERLATGAFDGTVKIWPLALNDLVAHARTLTGRSLSTKECKKYHIEPCPASK